MHSRAKLNWLLAASVCGFAGCGEDEAPPAVVAPPVAATAPAANAGTAGKPATTGGAVGAEGSGESPLVADYVYTPIGKRDPFRSFFEDNVVVATFGTQSAKCGPLCRWNLDQLKLVGIVSGIASPLAMVEDPDGRGYMVRRGSYIGKRSGKISDIRRDLIVVTELIRRNDGVLMPAKTELRLREKQRVGAVDEEDVDLSSPEGRER